MGTRSAPNHQARSSRMPDKININWLGSDQAQSQVDGSGAVLGWEWQTPKTCNPCNLAHRCAAICSLGSSANRVSRSPKASLTQSDLPHALQVGQSVMSLSRGVCKPVPRSKPHPSWGATASNERWRTVRHWRSKPNSDGAKGSSPIRSAE